MASPLHAVPRRQIDRQLRFTYLSSTLAPASSSFFLISSASALDTPSLTALGARLDEVLGFLEAEAGDLADDLDDVDLVGAGFLELDGELRLLLDRRSGGAAAAAGPRDGDRGCLDAPLVLERLDEVRDLDDRAGSKGNRRPAHA